MGIEFGLSLKGRTHLGYF